MTISENLSNGSSTAQDRFSGGVSAYRQNRRDTMTDIDGLGSLPARSPGSSHSIEPTGVLDRAATLPSLDLHGLTEPVFSATSWNDSPPAQSPVAQLPPASSMADHPLLRGLLMELPARGTMPPSDWLDRWFEAARSILELLYVQESRRK
jgi:hypothetical protein